jgi:uncharacterized membrane protein (UPF0127 family)
MTPRLARPGPVLVLALALACAPRPAAEPVAAARSPREAPAPRVVVVTAAGAMLPVTVELARSDEERARGLMYRRELAPEAGMLFLFSETQPRSFWMKNTLLPLDMLFIDDGGRVAGLIERAEPLTISPQDPGVSSRYVLEVNGGWAARHGVRPGDRVVFENVPRY